MKKVLLNLTSIQEGYKIQLIREVRKKWGEDKTKPGKRVAFYEYEDGRIVIESLD
jgi:hypothetical protein